MTPLGWLGHKTSTQTNTLVSRIFRVNTVDSLNEMSGEKLQNILTLVLLNKLRCHIFFNFSCLSDYLIQIVDINSHTKWQTVQMEISWLLRSQLIWIYTVCKDRAYPGSARQGLKYCLYKFEFRIFKSWPLSLSELMQQTTNSQYFSYFSQKIGSDIYANCLLEGLSKPVFREK